MAEMMSPGTPAFMCAKCGAVSLEPTGVCEVQGKVTKGDWCGSQSVAAPKYCANGLNTDRYKCAKCGRVAIEPEVLCEPEKMDEGDA